MNSREDECRAAHVLSQLYGFTVEQREKTDHRNPDLTLSTSAGDCLLCEVKSVHLNIVESGLLHSTIFNALTAKIRTAVDQFQSVNSARVVPNVLAWISHRPSVQFSSLVDLSKGYVDVHGFSAADLTKYRFGRVRSAFPEIDLHVWLYPWGNPGILVNADSPYADRLIRLFRNTCDPNHVWWKT